VRFAYANVLELGPHEFVTRKFLTFQIFPQSDFRPRADSIMLRFAAFWVFLLKLGPTNKAVHKCFPESSYARPTVLCIFCSIFVDIIGIAFTSIV